MPNISAPELIVILIIALLVLGPQRLPQVARSMGKGMREFKEALSAEQHDDDDEDAEALHVSRRPEG